MIQNAVASQSITKAEADMLLAGILLDTNLLGPCDQMAVDELGQLLGTGAGDQGRVGDLSLRIEKISGGDVLVEHDKQFLHF